MSVLVDLADLPKTLADFGRGYLLTSKDGRVKAVSVRTVVTGDCLSISSPGRGSVANVDANPSITLLFAPADGEGMTLLVDGTAVVDGEDVRITPTGAVLHKPVS